MAAKMTFDQYQQWLGDLGGNMKEAAVRGIRSGAMRGAVATQEQARRAVPASANGGIGAFNTGAYVRSIKSSSIEGGATIHSNSPYAGIIEHGRRPGAKRPPKQAIVAWAQRRLGMSRQEAENVAFVYARAIGARGLKARNVFKKAFPAQEQAVIKDMLAEVDKELRK
jgi:phage gpG-like protein